jgi:signal-transduction protein with cAMP-binding, CBS, and nucleotidyltransferase domain
MVRKRIGSLIIAENKKLLGFISEHDILWALIKKPKADLAKIKAIDISPRKIITIKPSLTIEAVIKKIKKIRFERFPVVENGELVGLITIKDILDFNPEFYPEFEELERVREESEKLKRIEKARGEELGKEGICEECGNQGILLKFNGMLVCESCKSSG